MTKSTNWEALIESAIEDAAHLLPAQKPIESFVHHNTLHAFEDLSFAEAVIKAGETYDAEPYMKEEEFLAAYKRGRILDVDLDAVLDQEVEEQQIAKSLPIKSLKSLVKKLMLFPWTHEDGGTLDWRITETKVLESYPEFISRDSFERLSDCGPAKWVLPRLWKQCLHHGSQLALTKKTPRDIRARDHILTKTGVDIDEYLHPFLIRW
ncbi:MAG: Na-translocating system protein MpsB, partial [Planctomycetota bacterium]|nr:Na-translocating system protein MpsB [Planctomycetota bacterium]